MIILRILNSPYANDLTRNSVLSHQDVDNNFIYLKGHIIYEAENSGGLVTLKKYNGETITFSASTGGSGGGGGSDSYWTSGSTGVGSIKAVNTTGLDATGTNAVAINHATLASGQFSFATGVDSVASGPASSTFGSETVASGVASHAEGFQTTASNQYSHAEGWGSNASGPQSHAEGENTTASGVAAHAEGGGTISSGVGSHAEGLNTIASGDGAHAEGDNTLASGDYSHAGGSGSDGKVVASGLTSFVHQYVSGSGQFGPGNYGTYGWYSAILGGQDHYISSGSESGAIMGGNGHLLFGTSLRSAIFGGNANLLINTYDGVVLGGDANGAIQADNSAIIGGYNNLIDAFNYYGPVKGFIGGGSNNTIQTGGDASEESSVIMGGNSNTINGTNQYVGIYNSFSSTATSQDTSVIINSNLSTIKDRLGVGGSYNNTIIGAYNSEILANSMTYVSIFGGANNNIYQDNSFTGVEPNYSLIIGGNTNRIDDSDTASIINGYSNTINNNSKQSTIINGQNHTITSSQFSTIIGGNNAEMTDSNGSAIIGGSDNQILSDGNPAFTRYFNAILGGTGNTINNSELSFIMGGYQNVIPYGKVGVVILGGDSITGSTNNTVYVQRLNIKSAVNDNTTTRFLTLDANNNIAFRNLSSISGSSSGSTGGDTLWASGTTGTGSIKAINTTGLDANGNYAVAINNATMADGNNSFAAGFSTWARGTSSMSVGQNTESFGDYSFAGGHNTIANGNNSFIWSTESTVTGQRSAVIGGSYINGLSADTVYVPYLNIQSATTDNTLSSFLVRNGNGVVRTRTLDVGTPFYLSNSPTTDAGSDKTSVIQRNGSIYIGDYDSSTAFGTHTFISKSAIGITSTGFTYFSLNTYTNNNSIAPRYTLYRRRGTQTTPLNLSKGDTLGQISFQTAVSGSTSETLIDNYIIVSANENHGGGTIGTSGGTIMDIYLTQNGQNTSTKVLSIDGKGDTRILGNLTATTISATTYYNLPNQTSVTGFTYSNNNLTIKQSSGELNVLVNTMTGLTINGNLTFTGQSNNPVYTAGTTTSTFTPNWNNSNIQHVILSAATTTINAGTNIKNGAVYTMIVKQNATGSRVVTWGSEYKWQSGIAPILTSTANGVDILTFISDGTNLYGLIAKDFR